MKLTDFSWTEICSMFADLGGCCLELRCSPHGDECSWSAEFCWHNENNPNLPKMDIASGFGCSRDISEEACRVLLQSALKYGDKFPGNHDWKIPSISFETKEQLEMQCAVAGIDIGFMLTHRCG